LRDAADIGFRLWDISSAFQRCFLLLVLRFLSV
jgi:hypothetical protein